MAKYPIHLTRKYARERQFNPRLCRKGTFRIKQVSPKTKLVLCKKSRSQKQSVQSILRVRK